MPCTLLLNSGREVRVTESPDDVELALSQLPAPDDFMDVTALVVSGPPGPGGTMDPDEVATRIRGSRVEAIRAEPED